MTLAEPGGRTRVLSVDEGHWRFAVAFASRYRVARLTCVDSSNRMLRQARRRAARAHVSVEWVHAALPEWRQLTAPDDLLRDAGFSLVKRQEFSWGLLRADLWQRA